MNYFLAFVLLAGSASAFAVPSQFLCTNRDSFPGPVLFKMTSRTASLSYQKTTCPLVKVAYKPNSSKYFGWIRWGAKDNAACTKFGSAIRQSKVEIDFHWISVSKEMQDGADGFAQFGYQNIHDPGAGGTAKLFVRCRASN